MFEWLSQFYNTWYLDIWIIVVGSLCAMSCALLGCFLVLRKMSMMGDAISHTVLPGLALAFMITHSRDSITMFIGACIIGVLTALFIQIVHRAGNLDEGASMGVVFTTLFAVGLILIRQAAHNVDLDPGCVLYGAIELTPLDIYTIAGIDIPRAAVTNGAVLLINIVFVTLLYKELKISSFDPELATTQGINANLMHYLLMTFVAVTTVAAFESVGSILVIAMLIVPGACAHLLTDRLSLMLLISLLIAVLCALGGHLSAVYVPPLFGYSDTITAGMMGVMAGAIFVVTLFFAPRYGVISRMLHQLLLALKVAQDDILGCIYRKSEPAPVRAGVVSPNEIYETVRSKGLANWAIRMLSKKRHIEKVASGFKLTERGLAAAQELVRSHRLWESYIDQHLIQKPGDVHYSAHQLEHVTDPKMQERLDIATGSPAYDPHHKKIPQPVEDREKQS